MFVRTAALITLTLSSDAYALVGNSRPAPASMARHVVLIAGSGGSFCSGVLIATDLVVTAGHCVNEGQSYKLIRFSDGGAPTFLDVASATRHPQFDIKAFLNHRAAADVAIMKLAQPLGAPFVPARLASSAQKTTVGDQLTIAGYGVAVRGDGKTGGTLRAATLTVTGQPGTLQIRLVDPITNVTAPGQGACTGDSGAPAFGPLNTVIGLVSWTTGPQNEDGCGGLTGLTPLSRYLPWITDVASRFGSPLPR
jgi:secreted trypsin-like serine protease